MILVRIVGGNEIILPSPFRNARVGTVERNRKRVMFLMDFTGNAVGARLLPIDFVRIPMDPFQRFGAITVQGRGPDGLHILF
ncbi:hypothetical protein D3C85_1790280 [compost metagenome]